MKKKIKQLNNHYGNKNLNTICLEVHQFYIISDAKRACLHVLHNVLFVLFLFIGCLVLYYYVYSIPTIRDYKTINVQRVNGIRTC